MRKFIITLAAVLCASTYAPAQSFLDHLQKDDKGGSVSVKQSDDINKLVNGSNKNNSSQTPQTDTSKPARDKNKPDNKSREEYERETASSKKDYGVEESDVIKSARPSARLNVSARSRRWKPTLCRATTARS